MNPETRLDHNNEVLKLGNIRLNKVLAVRETEKKETVFDLKVNGNENYVVAGLGLVHNGGKRAGAGTVSIPIWHNDIFEFLDLQTEHGDLRLKAYDVFPQVCINDIFMRRDSGKQHWTTFCPFEVKEVLDINIHGLYGEDFDCAYAKIEAAFDAGLLRVARRVENARELTKLIMRIQFETGLPYISFVDTINASNPNKGDYIIRIMLDGGKELVLSPDEIVATTRGNIRAEDLLDSDEIVV